MLLWLANGIIILLLLLGILQPLSGLNYMGARKQVHKYIYHGMYAMVLLYIYLYCRVWQNLILQKTAILLLQVCVFPPNNPYIIPI